MDRIRKAMEKEKNGFFNLGNGEGYSVRQVIETCEQISGKKIAAVEESRRAGDPPRLIASAHKAFKELNWKPKVDFNTGIRKTIKDIRINNL